MGVFFYVLGVPLLLTVALLFYNKHLYEFSPLGDKLYAWVGPLYLRYKVWLH